MTTALTIVSDALAELGVIGPNEAPSAEDSATALRYLNRLIAAMSTLQTMVFARTDRSISMTGAAFYSVSPRPLSIAYATCVDLSGLETEVDVVSRQVFDEIQNKQWTGGEVRAIYYDSSYSAPVVYVYPKAPSGYTLKLDVLDKIQTLEIGTTLQMPEVYEEYLVATLAINLAGQYGKQASPDLRARSRTAKNTIRRTNFKPVLLKQELAVDEPYEIERGS